MCYLYFNSAQELRGQLVNNSSSNELELTTSPFYVGKTDGQVILWL